MLLGMDEKLNLQVYIEVKFREDYFNPFYPMLHFYKP